MIILIAVLPREYTSIALRNCIHSSSPQGSTYSLSDLKPATFNVQYVL